VAPVQISKIVTLQSNLNAYDSILFRYNSDYQISNIRSYYYGRPQPENQDWYYTHTQLDSIVYTGYYGNPLVYGYLGSMSLGYNEDLVSLLSYYEFQSFDTSRIIYDSQGRISRLEHSLTSTPLNDNYNEFDYDGDNISAEYSYTRDSPDSAYKLFSTCTFIYDGRLNPFYHNYPLPYCNIAVTTDHAKYLSKNNVTSCKIVRESSTILETFTYIYNGYSLPTKVEYQFNGGYSSEAYYYN